MKISEICKKYGIPELIFVNYLKENDLPYTHSLRGDSIDDSKAEEYAQKYLKYKEEAEAPIKTQLAEIEEAEKKRLEVYTSFKICSCDSVPGGKSATYKGFVIETGRIFYTDNAGSVSNALVNRMREKAIRLGGNAIVGIRFVYSADVEKEVSMVRNNNYLTAYGTVVFVEE